MQLLKDYFDYYKVPQSDQKVPIIFVGSLWFSGAEAIDAGLQDVVSAGRGIGTVELTIENSAQDTKVDSLAGYNILGVLAAGLVNGLNPCSLSIVLFLLSLLVVKNVNLLKAGIAFILGKFIMFFFLGTLLYQLFLKANIDWFQSLTKIIVVALAIVFIVLNLRDMILAKRENYGRIKLQLPEKLRRYNHQLVKVLASVDSERIFLPLSFMIGMVIAAGEFLCTGQIYLATIVLVIQSSPVFDIRSILYFALYGLAFVFPLLLLIILGTVDT